MQAVAEQPLVQQVVRQVAAELRARFAKRLVGVRLFGSWARGEATADSDIDVCILIAEVTKQEKLEVFDRATELGWRTGLKLQTLVMAPTELQRLRDLEARIAQDIDREGIPA